MPNYGYKCEPCKVRQDVRKSVAEYDRKEHCPKCEKPMERTVDWGGGFVLKGGGWFKDDYGSKR